MAKKTNVAASILIPIFYLLLIIIILLIEFDIWIAPENTSLILIIVGISVAVIIGLIYLIIFILNRKQKKNEKIRKELRNLNNQRSNEITSLENTRPRISTHIIKKEKEDKGIILSKSILFKGKLKVDDFCGICKLSLRDDQEIYHCPKCQNLFHEEHLIDWLLTNQNCPICNYSLENYFTKS
ncbi:MAG TPA: RING finger domain-containing protein [candidate division Zixibacteria bacterium]|nr:RING finger domain-containing protein [candidate division Zixibacteria bacterium]